MTDTNGLKAILKHNEAIQPNDDLLNTLKAAIPQFFDKDGNFKTDKFEDELKKNNIKEARDGYKLGFVGKDYARLQVGLKSETMIVPDKRHNDKSENANSGNVFITGDNLDALRHIVNAYENKIKLIYIDPPYNTGKEKEFVYSDKFEFTDNKLKSILGYSDEEIARLKSIQGKSSHSAWLTFMYPRLKIAQKLLKDDGMIFISIDENEHSNLKLLMYDVFGESNFVGEFIWKCRNSLQHDDPLISSQTERIAVFARNKKIWNEANGYKFKRIRKPFDTSEYSNPDDDPRGPWLSSGKTRNDGRPSYTVTSPTGVKFTKPWIPSPVEFKKWEEEGLIWWGKNGDSIPRKKSFLKDFNGNAISDILFDEYTDEINGDKLKRTKRWEVGTTESGTESLKELFKAKLVFDYPKPYTLKKYLITICSEKNSIILDFFAGSATTAHAVMQLNAEDGGNRKFIMVQLDEETNPELEARKAGYNNIDEIARDRIRLAGKKILDKYKKDLINQTNGWDKDIGFKHYRLVAPDVKTLEKIIEFNPEETNLIADDMIKPFEYKKTETGGLDTILATWLIDDGYRFDTPVEEITFGNYKAHYVREAITLYLINMGWDTKALKDMLNQIGTNKLLVKTIVVYPYSFEFEAMRELKTNIKTNLDISPNLIERY